MATLVPWTAIEVGDLEIFAPAVPCLLVNTWYAEDHPESTVTYFWQDESTGLIRHEIVFAEPVGFEAALSWAQAHAPTRAVERIHVKHGPPRNRARTAAKSGGRPRAAPRRKAHAAPKVGRKKRARKRSSR